MIPRFLLVVGGALLLGLLPACGGKSSTEQDRPAEGQTCTLEGQVSPVGDSCNSCTCLQGAWICTEAECGDGQSCDDQELVADPCLRCSCDQGEWLCEASGADCDVDDACQPGATKVAEDGCNSCSCGSDGSWSCTEIDCGDEVCTEGEVTTYDCNQCSCEDGHFVCTERDCEETCVDGEIMDAGDGCNTCSCLSGAWLCSLSPCLVGDCGGPDSLLCADDEFCSYSASQLCGLDDVLGECEPRPDSCDGYYMPVCGCDRKTYSNACEAAMNGQSVLEPVDCAELY